MNEERENFTAVNMRNFNPEPINLRFNSIQYKVACKRKKEQKVILDNMSGSFYAGRLTAILGPSGAGKTSLLNILAGNKKKNVSGQILINEQEINPNEFQWQSSYIGQESALLLSLTTEETLAIATELKLPNSFTRNEKTEIISQIAELLGLQKAMSTRVGSLSGGEMKRLSIGVELVTNPPIMFFDEPTSGLDSVSSCQVVSHLQTLAKNGHTIICVIHQPSSKLFSMFDDVLVVADGTIIYGGHINEMVGVFESAGYNCPPYYNRADFALEIASTEPKGNLESLRLKSIAKSQELESSISNTIEEIASDSSTKSLPTPSSYHIVPSDDQNDTDILHNKAIQKSNLKKTYAASYIKQFWVLLKRSLLCSFRDLQLAKMRVLAHLVVGIILGFIYYDIGDDASKIMSNASLMFFLIMFIFFSNAMPTVLTFPLEAAVFEREQQNNWYSVYAYFTSKLMADFPLQVLCPTIFVVTTYYMTNQPRDDFRISMVWGICIIFTVIAQTIGLIMGVAFSVQMGIFSLPAMSIPMLIFSGFFLRFDEIPHYMKPFSCISYFGYGFEGLLLSVYDYDRPPLNCSVEYCYFKSPKKFLKEMDAKEGNYWTDVGILFGFIVLLQIILLGVLKYRAWNSR
ncbi:ATP-binding cassette sub-family G member 1-like [Arctopsyche grandis]|uniref:ATP-binding cassette sub-family G member 1-like n=1 Tax=Arctopsyche grandis TaxID=121162 RepID=UPI00406D69EB